MNQNDRPIDYCGTEFHLIVDITANSPADAEVVAGALARMRSMCLSEPGCVFWEAYRSQQQPLRFLLVERWSSHAHWLAHGELAAIQEVYVPAILPRITREVHPVVRLGCG